MNIDLFLFYKKQNKYISFTYYFIEVIYVSKNITNINSSKEENNSKKQEIQFSVSFNNNGDSFQNILEQILMNKLINNAKN